MPFRVREILLVSSDYDAFILEEDGALTDRIFLEYSELNLTSAPRITHVATPDRALALLRYRRFDLVLTLGRRDDLDLGEFCRQVRALDRMLPIALLVFSESELSETPLKASLDSFDGVFLWSGDTRLLLAIIKLIEDGRNTTHDLATAGVQVILLVEDGVRQYSSFLGLLYTEVMEHSHSLIAEGLNPLHKLMRMRTRPKILLAYNYESALEYFTRFRDHVMALISDVRFPHAGKLDPQAGYALVAQLRASRPDLPVLLQSSEEGMEARANELGVQYVSKYAHHFRERIRLFLLENLGFGPFVFRLPDRTEVGRAKNLYEMEQILKVIPGDSLEYHAARNHISTWLRARSMFDLANRLRPRTVEDFGGVEGLRSYLLDVLREARRHEQFGLIQDYTPGVTDPESPFVRLGKGSLGGKGRGLAFANAVLNKHRLSEKFPELEIRTPRTIVIGTDEFNHFMDTQGLGARMIAAASDEQLITRGLEGRLSEKLTNALWSLWQSLKGPLAVRSSSLLEDSHFQPFAGIYATYMLPNNHPDPGVRFSELLNAIKAVYASTYSKNARTYLANSPFSPEDEKMTVVIQEVIGQAYEDRFYPQISGVAMSYNYYPIGAQKPEEGVVLMALGLGQTVVQGGTCLRFSPTSPQVLPQFGSAEEVLQNAQVQFFALDLTRPRVDFLGGPWASLRCCGLEEAEQDGVLPLLASVYSAEDNLIRDDLQQPGPRVITFNNILKWRALPLAEALDAVLKHFRQDFGRPLEIEFAVSMGDHGLRVPRGQTPRKPCLYILQLRPLPSPAPIDELANLSITQQDILVETRQALGHGVRSDIQDVLYVRTQRLEGMPTQHLARQIGAVNVRLHAEKRPYLLVGPGRWGSSDPHLGIPVEWADIAGAGVIVETNFTDRPVEPSLGTHFFKNITAQRMGYLTLGRVGGQRDKDRGYIDLAWLEAQPPAFETPDIRLVHLARPLRIVLDGRSSKGLVLKPEET